MSDQISLIDITKIILKRHWIVTITACLIGIIVFIYSSFFMQPIYVSEGTLYVNNTAIKNTSSVNINDINASQKLVDTYIVILKSNKFLEKVSSDVNLGYSSEQIDRMVSMSSVNDTEVLSVKVSNTKPEYAKLIADNILKNAKDEIVRVVAAGSVEILDSATVPKEPSSPNIRLDTVIGFIAGIALGIIIVFGIEILDTRIKNEEDLNSRYSIPVIGAIPKLDSKK